LFASGKARDTPCWQTYILFPSGFFIGPQAVAGRGSAFPEARSRPREKQSAINANYLKYDQNIEYIIDLSVNLRKFRDSRRQDRLHAPALPRSASSVKFTNTAHNILFPDKHSSCVKHRLHHMVSGNGYSGRARRTKPP
jgi:hypothetical protein